jgi:hypothetical protein
MLQHSLTSTVYYEYLYGKPKDGAEETLKRIKSLPFIHQESVKMDSNGHDSSGDIWIGTDLALSIQYGKKVWTVGITTTDKKKLDLIKEALSLFLDDTQEGKVFIVSQSEYGLQLRNLGQAGEKLEIDNYPAKVVDAFQHVVKDLAKKAPCGRLVIINGLPGTGKTYLTRGLIHECSKSANFVIIPPHMVSQLTDPALITMLISETQEERRLSDGPIVLLVEDADSIIATRMADNMESVSSLLNFGSGLLGTLLDVRIIATTNAENPDIDKAVLRPGRLCRHISIGKLSPEYANKLLDKWKVEKTVSKPLTLAEIYQLGGDNDVEDSSGNIGIDHSPPGFIR